MSYRLIRRQRESLITGINIVPYVDVMLVLLIIFMITAPLLTEGVKIDLPKAQATSLESTDQLPLLVKVDATGKLFLNTAENPMEPISQHYLQVKVAASLKRNPKRQVLVAADRDVLYNEVLQTMVLLQKSGAKTVGLQTKHEERSNNA